MKAPPESGGAFLLLVPQVAGSSHPCCQLWLFGALRCVRGAVQACLTFLEHGKDVASRVGEPGDERSASADDALLVRLESGMALEDDATSGQLVDGGVDVLDLEVEAGS